MSGQFFSPADYRYMAEALRLAGKGLYTTEPNPRVGCVLVKDAVVVGRGYHQKAGEGHAEVNALADAGEAARGATAYVTLEPCSHFGKTPPCADALIEAGVSEVVAAMQDPNPQVAGRGFKKLQAAGVKCRFGIMEDEAAALNPGFIKRMTSGLPYVRIKLACSVDGRTAMASGESQWITGAAARSDVQRLRARSSAILCGIDSVLADDPAMTVRASQLGLNDELARKAANRQPLRVVLDSQGRIEPTAAILQQSGETLLVLGPGVQADARVMAISGVDSLSCELAPNRRGLDLAAIFRQLAERGCNEVLVETGATLAGAVLESGIWDELIVYMAPKLMGSEARPLMNLPLSKMNQAYELALTDVRQLGQDLRLTYRRPIIRTP